MDYKQEAQVDASNRTDENRALVIRQAMSECLGRPLENPNCVETFWEMGASSMDALVLQKLCEKKGVDVDLRAMFETTDLTAW